jgi:hypothetical protein
MTVHPGPRERASGSARVGVDLNPPGNLHRPQRIPPGRIPGPGIPRVRDLGVVGGLLGIHGRASPDTPRPHQGTYVPQPTQPLDWTRNPTGWSRWVGDDNRTRRQPCSCRSSSPHDQADRSVSSGQLRPSAFGVRRPRVQESADLIRGWRPSQDPDQGSLPREGGTRAREGAIPTPTPGTTRPAQVQPEPAQVLPPAPQVQPAARPATPRYIDAWTTMLATPLDPR